MKSRVVDLAVAVGELLAAAIVDSSGKKILSRGHRVEPDDLKLLSHKGVDQVWVVELGAEDCGESELLRLLGPFVAEGPVALRPSAAGGRIDLIALESSVLVLAVERMRLFNDDGAAVVSALPHLAFVKAGERLAAVRSAPFMAPRAQVARLRADLETGGPLMAVKAMGRPRVAVIYLDPARPERARELFEPVVRRRLERFGVMPQTHLVREDLGALTRALGEEVGRAARVIVIASTISPLLPSDAIGQAIEAVGGRLTRFLAPVEPGSMLLLAYAGDTAIVAPTGCFRSPRANAFDLILPPLLARHALTSFDIASLGAGGLLE
jgi:molybdenum cofactor cytidylyltransferase